MKATIVTNNSDFSEMCKNIGFEIEFAYSGIFSDSFDIIVHWPYIYGEILLKSDCVIFDIAEGDPRKTRIQTIVNMCGDIGMPIYWVGDIYNLFVDKNLGKEVKFKDGTFDRADYWSAIIDIFGQSESGAPE